MIYEAHKEIKNENEETNYSFSFKNIFVLSIATSIDAFASGISLAMLNVNIIIASLFIAIVTFILCIFGFYFGKKIGSIFQNKAQILGGIVLIEIAFKSLIG
jgi:putative Mn2+ efflux pump MntP